MLKPILTLAGTAVLGVVLWKILLLPLAGMLMGLLFTVVKIAVVFGLIFLVVYLLRRSSKDEAKAD
ncbi:MAG TPA: hypothetical protein VMH88_12635 [Gemmatimonadales bacterium]|nr:hypothetical protein [Gemmatimonadales bacterium]